MGNGWRKWTAALAACLMLVMSSGCYVVKLVEVWGGTTLTSEDGGYSLTLVIQDGKAHVEDSTCPDLICQNHAAISRDSEQIICLPARIVITVTGGEEEGFDAIAQ